MRIVTVDLSDSDIKELLEGSRCKGTYRPEHVRLAIREQIRNEFISSEQIRNEFKFTMKTKKEIEEEKITSFFDYCINCERRLDSITRKNHFFHKNIEVFELKFCCSCYKQFKDKTLDEFPTHIIDSIQKKVKAYKKYNLKEGRSDSGY